MPQWRLISQDKKCQYFINYTENALWLEVDKQQIVSVERRTHGVWTRIMAFNTIPQNCNKINV